MGKRYDYDIIAIGGGGAGITAVTLAKGLGKRAALVDKKKFGGECTWSGCVPSKALLHSAAAAYIFSNIRRYGLNLQRDTGIDCKSVMQTVGDIVNDVYSGETGEHFEMMGVSAFEDSEAVFTDRHTIEVNGKSITSGSFIITTGSRPAVPAVPGLADIRYFTNENIFLIKKLPSSMAVLGGGPIGIELASAFNRLGTKVSVIERSPSILPREDPELTDILDRILTEEGVHIINNAKVSHVEKAKQSRLIYEKPDGTAGNITADVVLVAAGRLANVEGLGLDNIGVKYGPKGIETDRHLRTSIRNIFAAGDVTGPFQFSHAANYQAIAAVTNALLPLRKTADYGNVPWCTFTDPELARSGLTETEAREKRGNRIRIYRVQYRNIDRSRTDKTEAGLAKFICDRKGKMLGIHILGARAGEIIHEAHAAKSLGIPLYRLNSVIHIYPTYSEIMRLAARDAYVDRIRNNPFVKIINKLSAII